MARAATLLLLLALLAGCHHQPGSSSLFSGFSATRVPPPGTGSFGSPPAYYQGPSKTQPSSGWRSTTDLSSPAVGLTSQNRIGTGVKSLSDRGSANRSEFDGADGTSPVASANYEQDEVVELAASPSLRVVKPARPSSGRLMLRGMPVSDATAVSAPSAFDPPTGAQSIPQAPATYASGITGGRMVGSGAGSSPLVGSQSSGRISSGGASNWRSRGATIRR